MSAVAGPPALQIEIIPFIVYSEAECDSLIPDRKLVATCHSCFVYSKMSDEDFSRTSWHHCVFVPWRWYCYDVSNYETNRFDTKVMPDYFPVTVRHKAQWTLTNALEVHVITGVRTAAFDARRQRLKRHRSRSQRTEFKYHSWWYQSRGIFTPYIMKTLDNKFQKIFCICDDYVINLFVCIYEVRKGT